MRIPSRASIGYRVLLPIFALIAGTTAALLLLVHRITEEVREDYHRLTTTAISGQVATILELAAAELTAARLLDQPVVVDAKKVSVREAIANFWSQSGFDGVIAAGDTVEFTTLDAAATRGVLAHRGAGHFILPVGERKLHCIEKAFPLWGWTVTTVAGDAPRQQLRNELVLLLPLLGIGAMALTAGLYLVLSRNLQRPVAAMVAAVEGEREVPPTGIAEFDGVGAAVNGALARVRERTAELARELERRRAAEQALRGKEEQIRLLLNSTAEGIYGIDTAGTCTFCNPASLRLLGYDREEELLGSNIHRLVHHTRRDGTPYPETECRIFEAWRERREVHVADEVFWRRDGTSFPVEYWSHPILAAGVVTGAVVAFFDVTHKAELEQQLRQAQKMEAVGRLAGGIAHDFNNMLMAIVGYAGLIQQQAEAGSKQRAYSEEVLVAAEKAAGLTRQILAFSRRQVMSPAPVDLNDVVLGLAKIITRLLGEDIQVGIDLAGGKLVATVDRGQIEQVLMNLCTNARDAMPGGGRLTIGSRAVSFDRESAGIHGLETEGLYGLITVSDTGCGMEPRVQERIFEPYFTTKELGKGTGLGLSIVYGIVRQHRGQINVYSEPGRGTTFRVYLPLTGEAEVAEAARPPAAVRGGVETVLVAEDSGDVRTLVRRVLEEAGYRVLEAADGEEAVRLFAADPGGIGLCLLDVVMPRKSGKEALAAIRELRPAARVLLMSGYATDILADARHGGADVPLLFKPLLPRELLRRVREALDA